MDRMRCWGSSRDLFHDLEASDKLVFTFFTKNEEDDDRFSKPYLKHFLPFSFLPSPCTLNYHHQQFGCAMQHLTSLLPSLLLPSSFSLHLSFSLSSPLPRTARPSNTRLVSQSERCTNQFSNHQHHSIKVFSLFSQHLTASSKMRRKKTRFTLFKTSHFLPKQILDEILDKFNPSCN